MQREILSPHNCTNGDLHPPPLHTPAVLVSHSRGRPTGGVAVRPLCPVASTKCSSAPYLLSCCPVICASKVYLGPGSSGHAEEHICICHRFSVCPSRANAGHRVSKGNGSISLPRLPQYLHVLFGIYNACLSFFPRAVDLLVIRIGGCVGGPS